MLHYDPATGKADGEIRIDVTSGVTGNGARDTKMHQDVLESERFPEAVFTPRNVEGNFSRAGASELQVRGELQLHGVTRELTLQAHVEIDGDRFVARLRAALPYAQWGMKNPSTLLLRVSDTVQLEVRAASGRARVQR